MPKPSAEHGPNSGAGHSPSGGPVVGPKLKGEFNDNGEPVIYLSQKDQKRVLKAGKLAGTGLAAAFGPAGKAGKALLAMMGVAAADFLDSKGICKDGKTLRITGTASTDGIKEATCV